MSNPDWTVEALVPEVALKRLREGLCPFCKAGPFRVPLNHVTRAHDVGSKDLRDRLGVPQSASLTDPEYREGRSAHAKQVHARHPGLAREASTAAVASRARTGRRKTRALRSASQESGRKGLEVALSRSREARDALLGEWEAGGRGWEDVVALAARHSRTPAQMAARLREAGASVPDGRRESPARHSPPVVLRACSVDRCGLPHAAKGYCYNHYYQAKRSGALPANPRKCSLEGCDKPHAARGYCNTHYRNPTPRPRPSSTGVRNVYLRDGRYRVSFGVDGKQRYFGSFSTLEEAAEVADRTRLELTA